MQVVNGWNNVTTNNGGVTIGLTNALVKPKYTWNVNYYTGPSNADTQNGYRNLIDTTLLLTPNAKFNAYLNYDYGQNRDGLTSSGRRRYKPEPLAGCCLCRPRASRRAHLRWRDALNFSTT